MSLMTSPDVETDSKPIIIIIIIKIGIGLSLINVNLCDTLFILLQLRVLMDMH